jgi:hypothetical protein
MWRARKVPHMRRLIPLLALAAIAVPFSIAASAESASASVAVPAPLCDGSTRSIVPCDEASSPAGTVVTWHVYDEASTPQNFTITGGNSVEIGCAGNLHVYYTYVKSGVSYLSATGIGICIKGSP